VPIGEGSYRLRFSYHLQRWFCTHVYAAGFRNSARRCSFPIGALKSAEWLRSCMGQYRFTMNDMSKAIGEIGFERAKNTAANGA
jgi:hypothetical protein